MEREGGGEREKESLITSERDLDPHPPNYDAYAFFYCPFYTIFLVPYMEFRFNLLDF